MGPTQPHSAVTEGRVYGFGTILLWHEQRQPSGLERSHAAGWRVLMGTMSAGRAKGVPAPARLGAPLRAERAAQQTATAGWKLGGTSHNNSRKNDLQRMPVSTLQIPWSQRHRMLSC